MKIVIALSTFSAIAFIAASPVHSNVNIVARQAAGNDSAVPECQSQCASFFQYSDCPDPVEGGDPTVSYGCVCNAQFFDAIRSCAACTPELFSDNARFANGIDGFIADSITACAQNGFPVNVGNTTSGSPQTTVTTGNTSAVATPTATPTDATSTPATRTLVPPTTRASDTGAPVTTSSVPAQPTGAASHAHAASGLFAGAVIAGLYVLI